jgi:CDP-diacylglycerol pyrophosphatase
LRAKGAEVVAALLIAAVSTLPAHADSDPDVLWRFVHEQCVPDQLANLNPAPCTAVDLSAGVDRGYAVFKDYVGAHQYLLIPTTRVTGLEDPGLQRPDAPNYVAEAWRARAFTEASAGGALPRDWISLAINGAFARTQNQLHIHIDCLRPEVHQVLIDHAGAIGPVWAPLPVPLAGSRYDALAVRDLDAVNPVALAAEGADPGLLTLAVVGTGTESEPGFVLLRSQADPAAGLFPAAERLQDHTRCPAPLPPGPLTAK